MENRRILNSSIEFGLRVTVLLSQFENEALALDKLLTYDYLLTNSGEFSDKYPSLHVETPYRYAKLVVKREVLKEGINLMCENGILDVVLTDEGILYKQNGFTKLFLNNISSKYKHQLEERANWIASEIHRTRSKIIEEELNKNVLEYGIEFYREG
ncbi:ABC-three component system middle component 2 [Ruminiclostridium cellobioparum]|uniref:Threonine efflux protein n=1 Tax=Ruminiclostridium cellobioparum subsp. termitidis CT1112 TaxID=1195236 RepID=S0FS39_RUMCE|nr:ABC-three component system middle component 2 [Ruminiclostridium cellobioparum]EMS71293.1 hypothetical protein CTER_2884 [Ruminiclostridium cellobioparum subsp. termitidis CT1112]